MILYADVLFAVNFIMDYLSLYAASCVLRLKAHRVRRCSAALLGAAYCVIKLYITLPEPFCAVAVSLVMCAMALWNGRMLTYIKAVVLFYAVSMLSGGVMTFLYETAYRYRGAAFFAKGLSPGLFFALAGVVSLFVFVVGKLVSHGVFHKTVRARIQFGETAREFGLLCDTGNLLRDPYSDLPVIVMSANSLDGLLGCEGVHRHPERAKTDEALRYKLRYIPVHTAAGESVLPALRADRIGVMTAKGREREIHAVIAVDLGSNGFGGSDGIIPYSAVCDL